MITAYPINQIRVEVARNWGTWAVRGDLIPVSGSDGQGQVLGDFVLKRYLGRVAQPRAALLDVAIDSILGQFVRVSGYDSYTEEWTVFWYGVVTGDEIQDLGKVDSFANGMGLQVYSCTGLGYVLAQIHVVSGTEYRSAGAVSSPTRATVEMPRFNALALGDRSESTVTLGGSGPGTCYVHLRHREATDLDERYWTAKDIIQHVLYNSAAGEFAPSFDRHGALRWDISDPDDALGFIPQNFNAAGLSVLDVVNQLVNPRRGLTWRIVVNDGSSVASVTVHSISASAISSPGYTLPASSKTTAINGNEANATATIRRDSSAQYDVIQVTGARPWVGITLEYSATTGENIGLAKGWTSEEETASGANDGAKSVDPKYDHVFRRFLLNNEWGGRQFKEEGSASVGIRTRKSFSAGSTIMGESDAADGWSAGQPAFNSDIAQSDVPAMLEITRDLPCSLYFNEFADGEHATPQVFFYDGETWESWNTTDKPGYQISVENNPASITLGTVDQWESIKAAINTEDARLLVTVGLREGQPQFYQWARPSEQWARSTPRILCVKLPDYEDWLMLPGTVIGAGEDSLADPPITTEGLRTTDAAHPLIVRQDSYQLEQVLLLLRAYYAEPAISGTVTYRGAIFTDTSTDPGSLVTTLQTGQGDITANAVLIRRAWDFSEENYSTTLTIDRLVPDVESIR